MTAHFLPSLFVATALPGAWAGIGLLENILHPVSQAEALLEIDFANALGPDQLPPRAACARYRCGNRAHEELRWPRLHRA
jgi:hypothetical protein